MAWEVKRHPQVAVGILIGGEYVHRDMLKVALALHREPGWLFLFETQKTDIALSRNILAAQALQEGVQWLFYLDSDIVPPNSVIPRLISHAQPVVSGLYWRRYPQMEPCAYRVDQTGIPKPMRDEDLPAGALVEVDAVGAGCLLINVPLVLAKLSEQLPSFELLNPDTGQTLKCWKFFETIVQGKTCFLSEDVVFCSRVRHQLGYKIFLDTSIRCGHLTGVMVKEGRMGFTPLTLGRDW
jgi:hypothetical protein